MKITLKATTALITGLSLAMPVPVSAQQGGGRKGAAAGECIVGGQAVDPSNCAGGNQQKQGKKQGREGGGKAEQAGRGNGGGGNRGGGAEEAGRGGGEGQARGNGRAGGNAAPQRAAEGARPAEQGDGGQRDGGRDRAERKDRQGGDQPTAREESGERTRDAGNRQRGDGSRDQGGGDAAPAEAASSPRAAPGGGTSEAPEAQALQDDGRTQDNGDRASSDGSRPRSAEPQDAESSGETRPRARTEQRTAPDTTSEEAAPRRSQARQDDDASRDARPANRDDKEDEVRRALQQEGGSSGDASPERRNRQSDADASRDRDGNERASGDRSRGDGDDAGQETRRDQAAGGDRQGGERREADRDAEGQRGAGRKGNSQQAADEATRESREPVAALRGDSDGGRKGKVERERITRENSRSSDEEFQSNISEDRRSAEDDDDDDGLSTLEKALLVGAGALAVGSMLSGNREVVARSDDRIVVSRQDGGYGIIKDDNALLRRPGNEVETETFSDGSTRTVVTREDGSQIVTIRDSELRVLRRTRITPDGREYVLIDDTMQAQPVDLSRLASYRSAPVVDIVGSDEAALRRALEAQSAADRAYSLNQVRNIEQVRALAPAIDLDNITFESGSAAISPEQAEELTDLGQAISSLIDQDPREIVLIEGHTDAVGDPAYNLALSDRRAESVALALSEYFDVPPENMVVQGYGEEFLKVDTDQAEQANRRVTVRRITPLLQVASAN